jgi:3-phenylpropionate/cinnamic acid dioxygenase small subunit
MAEDKVMGELRSARLSSAGGLSQHPPRGCLHLLQNPTVETFEAEGNHFVVRSEFHYTEAQGDDLQFYVGTCFHHLTLQDGALKMKLKRVNLLNCDAALPAVQLFI